MYFEMSTFVLVFNAKNSVSRSGISLSLRLTFLSERYKILFRVSQPVGIKKVLDSRDSITRDNSRSTVPGDERRENPTWGHR